MMPASRTTPSVILLCTDLMMTSSVGGATEAAGLPLRTISSADQIATNATEDDLVLIDLATPGLDIAAAANALSEPVRRRTIVYGPHVHTAHFSAARDAGFPTVIARGEFAASVARRVAEFAAT